ncbi:hypothetical protein GQ457_08G035210 [Hibiscus cannabinus]
MQQYCGVVLKQLRSQRPRKYQSRIIKVNIKDLKPKRIKDCLECKISQMNLNQPRKSAQAGPVVSCRDIPFVIQLKQIIEAPR